MHLFYTPDIDSDHYTFNPEESKHCIKVLRLTIDDKIFLTDGKGNLMEAVIVNDNIKSCSVKIINTQREYGKRNFKIHIAVAPTKNLNRIEWFLEKATEISIDEITPLICDHSEKINIKTDRLNKIITSAVKQSLKAYHPVIYQPVKFYDLIFSDYHCEKYIAWCGAEKSKTLKSIYTKGKDALILIGPEGDFSENEMKLAIEKGFIPVSLGESRLRTETAAIVACHTINLLNE